MPPGRRPRLTGGCAGFSLVELLIVVTLVPIISLAIFFCFRNSTLLWQTLNQEMPEENIAIFNLRAETDFRQALRYKTIPFFGSAQEVSFADYVQTLETVGGEHGIGEVKYRYDETKQIVIREERNMSDLHTQKLRMSKVVLQNVDNFLLSYLGKNEQTHQYVWHEEWQQPGRKSLPCAVKLDYTQTTSLGNQTYTAVFEIPTGEG